LSDFRYAPEVKTLTLQIKPSLVDLAPVERRMKRQSVVKSRDTTLPWVDKKEARAGDSWLSVALVKNKEI
jgi:hypothetical protein